MIMKKTLALLLILSLLAGVGAFQAALMDKLLIGRWMLYAGGGEETWDFRADGTCISTSTTIYGEEITKTRTWRVEKATEEDLEKLWSQPRMVLVIDETERYGLHLELEELETTLGIMRGGVITDEERALTAPLPLCISLTNGIGGGGYVRMKDE